MNRTWPVVLTVAGSDPSGGAGLQADLKTFAALEVYGAAAVTAVTVQNTKSVTAVHALEPALIAGQMRAVLVDLPVAVVKIGMLAGGPQAAAVAAVLEEQSGVAVVLDPVLTATSGGTLLDAAGMEVLRSRLLPLASVVTPNLPEARLLAGVDGDAALLGQRLLQQGAGAVLVTGGHGHGEHVEDVLVTAHGLQRFRHPRRETRYTHGTGCTLASAVAAGLARSMPVAQAVETAVEYVDLALKKAWPLGQGCGPVHHMHALWKEPS